MMQLFYGADTFTLSRRLKALRAELDADGMLDSNTSTFTFPGPGFDEVRGAALAMPFLGGHRLVVLDGLLAWLDRGNRGGGNSANEDASAAEPEPAPVKGKKRGDEWTGLSELAGQMPPGNLLLLIEGDYRPAGRVARDIFDAAEKEQFRPLDVRQGLPAWLEREARERGIEIAQPAAAELAQLTGPDLWALSNELDKLAAYRRAEQIRVADVRLLCASSREASVFAMVDAAVQGDGAKAQRLLEELRAGGAATPYLITMLARQVRILVQVRELQADSIPRQEIGKRVGVTNDYALDKAIRQAARVNHAGLVRMLQALLEADVRMKTGQMNEDVALDLALREMVGVAVSR
jgi:DNA polymerase-3 subunit delta